MRIFERLYERLAASRMVAPWVYCSYDVWRYIRYAGVFRRSNIDASRSRVIMAYHVIEKGLTMPSRRFGFGHEALLNLIRCIQDHDRRYGIAGDCQLENAIGVVKEYLAVHVQSGGDMTADPDFWGRIRGFCEQYSTIQASRQLHFTEEEFFAGLQCAFPEFAATRHTVRNYDGTVPETIVMEAVQLAMSAPSACNRQHVRVHCICNHALRDKILPLQNGNRGFGCKADKLLVVSTDLSAMRWAAERNDGFTNAGIFIMNLCYALHYRRVACCILNWSVGPIRDLKIRRLISSVGPSENIAAIIACGKPPAEFDVASSPRKAVGDVLTFVR